MSIDLQPENLSHDATRMTGDSSPILPPRSPQSGEKHSGQSSPWLARGVIAVIAVAIIAAVTSAVLNAESKKKTINALTHEISRGDLTISVTEEGALESSNNFEIKCPLFRCTQCGIEKEDDQCADA